MTMENGNILGDTSAVAGETSAVVEPEVKQPETPATQEFLTKESLRDVLKELMPEYLEPFKDRVAQSAKDRLMREVERKAKVADVLPQKLRNLIIAENPELEEKIRLAELEASSEATSALDKESEASRQMTDAATQTRNHLLQQLQEFGIDPNDKRIDWARDVKTYNEGMQRFNKSVAGIVKLREADIKAKAEKRTLAEKAKLEKELGVESVNVPNPEASLTDNQEWLKQWGSGSLPATKENIDKANKLIYS